MSNKVTITGLNSRSNSECDQSLVTHLLAIELPSFFSMLLADGKAEALLKSLHDKGNIERVAEISKQIKLGVDGIDKAPFPSLTFILGGQIDFKEKRNGLADVTFDKTNTLIAGGILELVAISKLLGFDHPFEPTRKLTKQEIVSNSQLRQSLAKVSVQVTVVFNTKAGLSTEDMLNYCTKYNSRQVQLQAPMIVNMLSHSPINDFVEDIIEQAQLANYGGMTRSSIRLNKSELGIVAEGTLIKFILGAIGGASPQDKNKIEDFNAQKGKFSSSSIEYAKPHIISFLKTWLFGIKDQLKNDRNGFHYSPSLWLALGLIINNIINEFHPNPSDEIHRVSKRLSKIDYSKSAKHWANCEVLELDAKGTEYKNASGGGRPLRLGLSKYLQTLAQES